MIWALNGPLPGRRHRPPPPQSPILMQTGYIPVGDTGFLIHKLAFGFRPNHRSSRISITSAKQISITLFPLPSVKHHKKERK